ncbi:hypothetical protein [Vibrio alginolyticus]|uniref:hypothetical protein n=1 Tax=Vibrio alginolyticus TaxID=663 RepID=UPI001BD22259|nr:hypothetical protein [Vibrio alginolyticus]MBS9939866.1 hypothetical protein [Vibrio alginolyticus]
MMSALSDLYRLVRQRCAGVVDIMMDDALRDSYREFCEKSEFLKTKVKLTAVVSGVQIPVAGIPTDSAILKIDSVVSNFGSPLYVNDDYVFDPVTNEFTFTNDFDAVTVTAVLKPKLNFDENNLNSYLVENYGEALAAGAAYRLRLQVGTNWFNPDLALMYEREFIEGYRRAYRISKDNFNSFKNKVRKHNFY